MANIMILGASILQTPLIKQAKAMGYDTVVVSPQPREPGFEYATYSVFVDVRDEAEVLKWANYYNVCAVVTDQTDIPVRTAAYIADQLGLPGIGHETACLFTDKYLMRERCKELGIPTLRYKLVDTVGDAIDFFQTLDRDAIIKPIDNQGSKGVYRIRSAKELINKFDDAISYSGKQALLIEEFVTGREFVVEGLAFEYEFENLVCGDTHYFDIPDVFSATTRIFPSQANAELVRRVLETNKKIIKGFGLRQGITHSEFIVDGDDIYLIETAARGGGVFISSDLISLSTGLNTEKFLINIATGKQKTRPKISCTGIVCCYVAFFLPVGEVVSVQGIEQVKEMPFTHRHSLDSIRIGDRTSSFRDKTARNFIIVSADNHTQLSERVDLVRKTLDIVVKTEKGFEGPIWA